MSYISVTNSLSKFLELSLSRWICVFTLALSIKSRLSLHILSVYYEHVPPLHSPFIYWRSVNSCRNLVSSLVEASRRYITTINILRRARMFSMRFSLRKWANSSNVSVNDHGIVLGVHLLKSIESNRHSDITRTSILIGRESRISIRGVGTITSRGILTQWNHESWWDANTWLAAICASHSIVWLKYIGIHDN